MAISPLADGKILCTWEYNKRNAGVTKITPHHMAGKLSGKQCAQYFRDNGIENSANYCIGYDGDIYCNVLEENRAWTSSSPWNDHRAITVELSNSAYGTDHINEITLEKFMQLATDIALRYGIKKYEYTGDSTGSFTLHRMYAGTSCPGDYFVSQIPRLIKDINQRIKNGSVYKTGWQKIGGNWYYFENGKKKIGWITDNGHKYYTNSAGVMLTGFQKISGNWYYFKTGDSGRMLTGKHKIEGQECVFDKNGILIRPKTPPTFQPYIVKITADVLNIRAGAGTNYKITGTITDHGKYTIVAESTGTGASKWGKLKSGRGWIALDYTEKTI